MRCLLFYLFAMALRIPILEQLLSAIETQIDVKWAIETQRFLHWGQSRRTSRDSLLIGKLTYGSFQNHSHSQHSYEVCGLVFWSARSESFGMDFRSCETRFHSESYLLDTFYYHRASTLTKTRNLSSKVFSVWTTTHFFSFQASSE